MIHFVGGLSRVECTVCKFAAQVNTPEEAKAFREKHENCNPCEWNPAEDRAAWHGEDPHAQATLVVGSDGDWRLCADCATLPRFKRFRVRRPCRERAQ